MTFFGSSNVFGILGNVLLRAPDLDDGCKSGALSLLDSIAFEEGGVAVLLTDMLIATPMSQGSM
jgi:hypothetical protein